MLSPAEIRLACRNGTHTGPTAGLAAGYVQANLVILPMSEAGTFLQFCHKNSQACPLLEVTAPGGTAPRRHAPACDLRTDLPRYRVWRGGELIDEPCDIRQYWRDDFVSFLLGCSFTFESALSAAGLPVRHVELGCNVPMYKTNLPCTAIGKFAGPTVASMRPFLPDQVERATEITTRLPKSHGGPLHVGDPAELGIANLQNPDFGDPPEIRPGEIPVFWACGVTPQLALEQAGCEWAISHYPGCMLVTDLCEETA